MKIGILGFQGAFIEHIEMLNEMNIENTIVRDKDDLDHRALIEAIDALFNPEKKYRWFDSVVIRGMVADWRPRYSSQRIILKDHGDPEEIRDYLESLPTTRRRIRHYPLDSNIIPWQRMAYPKFGLYLFWRDEDFVAFRCFQSIPFYVPDGHFHDDNLGLEIMLAKNLIVSDPGTYVYTADPGIRNEYRQSSAHDCPRGENWEISHIGKKTLFTLRQDAYGERTCWRDNAVAGKITHANGTIYRLIWVGKTEITVWDGVSTGSLRSIPQPPKYCQGYGRPT